VRDHTIEPRKEDDMPLDSTLVSPALEFEEEQWEEDEEFGDDVEELDLDDYDEQLEEEEAEEI
jgi:hypothetical protein